MIKFDVDVIAGRGNYTTGMLCYPSRGDEVNENSIIVIPHGGEEFHVHGMKCKAIITEIGNRLCHLAIVTREAKKTIVRLPNAIEMLKDTKRVIIDCPQFDDYATVTEM